jgi:hypothetical protein
MSLASLISSSSTSAVVSAFEPAPDCVGYADRYAFQCNGQKVEAGEITRAHDQCREQPRQLFRQLQGCRAGDFGDNRES